MAVGFASKRAAPNAGLGVLMAAPMALDLLWPLFLVTGLEKVQIDPGNTAFTPLDFISYPYSHSLTMSALWGALFGFAYWTFTRYARGAVVLSFTVISHWILDAITHKPDMPLTVTGPAKLGLGLWNSISVTITLEAVLFASSVWLYNYITTPRDRVGRNAFWGFVAFSVISYLSNVFGPPPPSEDFLAKFAFSIWIFVIWAWWFDRHRSVRVYDHASEIE
ncbi:MAG: hypothetical protein ABL967_06465 [Bryobacteraceae bacterium]